ncbi:unnamed protein product [Phytophthora lilii]|uniref:Unnamed protein product n=1 Tax=Phytophthora lilii TaxID=2077276 RepID=A0A9W7D887_9STRA|nr:unnamed protein product [Phytophthora lilii]
MPLPDNQNSICPLGIKNLSPDCDHDCRIRCLDTAVLDADGSYRKSNGAPVHHRLMGIVSVVAVTYFFGCGGPLGSEPIISSTGPAIGLPAMLLYPMLVTVPYAFIVAELCCAFPEDGGFTVWVFNACGPFWAFQVGYWSWMAGIFNTALLPGFLLEILSDYYGVSIPSGFAAYAVKLSLSILFTFPCLAGTKVVSRTCVALLACVLMPVLVFTAWGYSRSRDFGDLFEVRHEGNIIHHELGDDEQVGDVEIDWALLLNTLFWAFDGINMASVFGGEVSNPARAYPRAIALTVALTLLTYLVPMPAAILVDDPNWTYFTHDSYPALAEAIGGSVLKAFFVFSSCCSVAGLFVSGIFCKSFQLSGMSDVQLLPGCFAWRSSRFDAPYVSIGVTSLFTMALLGVDFNDLLPMANAFAGAVQLLIILAAIRLRKLLPYIPRPVRVPGGTRVLAGLAGLPTVVLCYIVFDTFRSMTSTLIVLAFLLPGLADTSGPRCRSPQSPPCCHAAMSSTASFPIARVQLPKVSLSRLEQWAMKRMVTRMLQHTVREFDQHAHANGGAVDLSRWKAVGSRDDLRVFREREAGATSAALAFALDKTDVLPHGSTVAPLTPLGTMMTGVTRGKVENAMDAVVSKSQADLALVLSFMHHEDVVDCAVLHTIEAPTETDPFHFLGIKYFARRAPAAGETPRHPRTLHSVRYLYRQQSEDVVEVFMQGTLNMSGMTVKPLASTYRSDALFGLSTLVACAEAKRLTQMWRAQQARNSRQDHRKQQSRRASTALKCSMCRHKQKLFGGASLASCELCAGVVCTRCRTDKKVFDMDANRILGRFRKLSVTCVLAANKALSQPDEPQMLIVMSEHLQLDHEGSRDRRRRGASSTGCSGTRSRSDSSCLSASSEECLPTPRAHRRGRNQSTGSTASTASSRSYRECPAVSKPAVDARAHGHPLVFTINDQQMELQQERRRQANAVKTSAHRTQRSGRGEDQRGHQQQQLTLRGTTGCQCSRPV